MHVLPVVLGEQRLVVGVQLVHRREVSCSYSNDDDRQGQLGPPHYLIYRLLHVVDDAVRQYQENIVFLIVLGDLKALCHIVDKFDHLAEVCWAEEVDVRHRAPVGFEDAVESVAFRVENVAIESETMRRCSLAPGRFARLEDAAEAVAGDLLVPVVEL